MRIATWDRFYLAWCPACQEVIANERNGLDTRVKANEHIRETGHGAKIFRAQKRIPLYEEGEPDE